jgi:hypothetical protein
VTTYGEDTFICSICQTASDHLILNSTNRFGYPDLDTRPPPMQRDTIHVWIQECPKCGYVAADISESGPAVSAFLAGNEWRRLRAAAGRSGLVDRFERRAAIERALGNLAKASQEALHGAWAADDADDDPEARRMRVWAAELMAQALAKGLPQERAGDMRVQLVDVLRRVGDWSGAEAALAAAKPSNPTLAAILALQRRLVEGRDDGCYTIGDAMKK